MEVGHWIAVYTELFSDPLGKFIQSPYKRPTVIIWGSYTLVTVRWTVIFFVGPAGKYGLSTGTSSVHVRHALVSLQCFLCFWWTGTKIHFPFSSKFENGPGQWREKDGFLSTDINACILPCFWHQLAGGLGRKRYKRNYMESADRADILLGPLAVYPLL